LPPAALVDLTPIVKADVVLRAFDQMVAERTWYDPLFLRLMSFSSFLQAFRCSI
jgi:hypothetical protein